MPPGQPVSDVALPPEMGDEWALIGPGDGWSWEPGATFRVAGSQGPPARIEPAALVACAAWAAWVRQSGGTIRVDDSLQSPYLWNVGLLTALVGQAPWCDKLGRSDSRFVPLCAVKGNHRTKTLVERVLPVLHLTTARARQAVGAAIKELAYNAKEHPKSTLPANFAAGWFKGDRRVTFAFADTGIGVKQSLKNKGLVRADESDRSAIEKAFQPGVTGAGEVGDPTAPANGGLGLHITRTYAQSCNGTMQLASGRGRFAEHGLGTESWVQAESTWTGTLVTVTLYPDDVGSFPSLAAAETTAWRLMHSGEAPEPGLTLRPPVDSVGFSDDKDWFIRHRPELEASLSAGQQVQLDFGGAAYSAHSALNAMLGKPLRELGPGAAQLIWVSGARGPIERVLQVVVAEALATHEKDPI